LLLLASDTSLWLHNKLGTSNDSWTGGSIVSQLSTEMLVKIENCFQDLQPQERMKQMMENSSCLKIDTFSFYLTSRRGLDDEPSTRTIVRQFSFISEGIIF
jgi:hypothetical protein